MYIPVEFCLYSTYGWYWIDAHLEEQDNRAVLVIATHDTHPYAGTWLPEQRFPDWYNDKNDPRFTDVVPIVDSIHPSGGFSSHKEITFMTPEYNGYPSKKCTVKQYPYISNAPVWSASLQLVNQPTEEERTWLKAKAFPQKPPHFRAGHQTLLWVFGEQEAAHVALFIHDTFL